MALLYHVVLYKTISTRENKKEAMAGLRKVLEIQLLYVLSFLWIFFFFKKPTNGEKSMAASNT